MSKLAEFRNALLQTASFPVIPGCVHYAGNEKFIRKAFALQDSLALPFDVCLDLEDGAEHGKEKEQLELIIDLIKSRQTSKNKRLGVRISPFHSGHWIKQVEALISEVGNKLSFLTIPKTRSGDELYFICKVLQTLGASYLPLHVLIETLQAVAELEHIARLPQVEALEFGIMDFISETNGAIPLVASHSPEQFEHEVIKAVKTRIVLEAARNSKVPVHNVCTTLTAAMAKQDAEIARSKYGFLRMWSIHPEQITPIAEAMKPNFNLVPRAYEILLRAQAANYAPIRYEDTLMDRASYRSELNLLLQAEMWGVTVPG